MKVTVKTIGASPVYPNTSIEIDAKLIANAIQQNISGKDATDMQADQITQDFVDQFNVQARYSSGTLIGFKISDEVEDAFEKFKRY